MKIWFKGIKIKVSFFFALAVTLISIYDKSNIIMMNLFSALMHEAGHLFFLLLWSDKPKEINFTPFGIRIERSRGNRLDYKKEIVTAFAGPAVNLVLAVVMLSINYFVGNMKIKTFAVINLIIAFLNLLPCEPLDGAKMLKAFLMIKASEEKVGKIVKIISAIVIFPIAFFGFYTLIKSGYNFSLIFLSLYLIAFLIFKKD